METETGGLLSFQIAGMRMGFLGSGHSRGILYSDAVRFDRT